MSRLNLSTICARNPADPRCPRPREQNIEGGGGGGGGGAVTGRGTLRVNDRAVNVDEGSTVVPPPPPEVKREAKASEVQRSQPARGSREAPVRQEAVFGDEIDVDLESESGATDITRGPSVYRPPTNRVVPRLGRLSDNDIDSFRTIGSLNDTESIATTVSRRPRGLRTLRPTNQQSREVDRVRRPTEESTDVSEQPTVVGDEGRTFQRGAELPRRLPKLEQIAPRREVPFGSTGKDLAVRDRLFGRNNFEYSMRTDPFFQYQGSAIEAERESKRQMEEEGERKYRQMISERGGGYTDPVEAEDYKGYNFFDGERGFNPPAEPTDPVEAVGGTLPVPDPPAPTTSVAETTVPEDVAGGGAEIAEGGGLEDLAEVALL